MALSAQDHAPGLDARHLDGLGDQHAQTIRLFVHDGEQLALLFRPQRVTGKERGAGRFNGGQGGLELVRQRVQQCGFQFVALARGFGFAGGFLNPQALQADRHQVAETLEG